MGRPEVRIEGEPCLRATRVFSPLLEGRSRRFSKPGCRVTHASPHTHTHSRANLLPAASGSM